MLLHSHNADVMLVHCLGHKHWIDVWCLSIYMEGFTTLITIIGVNCTACSDGLLNNVTAKLLYHIDEPIQPGRVSEYYFTSLSAQSRQYRDRRKPRSREYVLLLSNDFKGSSKHTSP